MRVIYPQVNISVMDAIYSGGVRLLQSNFIQRLDKLRKPDRSPYSPQFVRKMAELGVDMSKIGWRDAMTFLPYRAEYLISQIERSPPKRLLEVGAGSSTLLFAALAYKYGFDVVSLENHAGSVQYVDYLLNNTPYSDLVTLQICDFRKRTYADGKPYRWYAADIDSFQPFDFVFVDGPMSTLVGRNGALPEVARYLAPSANIYLGDVNRSHEKLCLNEWRHYYPDISIHEDVPGIARIAWRSASEKAD